MFRVGQKVVCIDDEGDKAGRLETFPVKGSVYTIRECFGRTVLLAEIVNRRRSYIEGFGELLFKSRRFRPVIERKTDISIFTKMLTPQTRRIQERA